MIKNELDTLKSGTSNIADLQRENVELVDVLHKLEDDIAEMKSTNADLTEKNQELVKATQDIAAKEAKFLQVQNELDEVKTAAKRSNELSQENQDLKNSIDNLNTELNSFKEKFEQLEDSNRELKSKSEMFDNLRGEMDKYKTSNDELKSSLAYKVESISSLEEEISSLKSKNVELESVAAAAKKTDLTNTSELDEELIVLREANAHLQDRLAEMSKNSNMASESRKSEVDELQAKCAKYDQLMADFGAKDEKLTEVQEELDCLKSSIDELSELQDEYQQLKVLIYIETLFLKSIAALLPIVSLASYCCLKYYFYWRLNFELSICI